MLTSFKTYKEYTKQIRQIYKIYWKEGEQLWIEETRRELKSFYENHNFLFSHLNKRYKKLFRAPIIDNVIFSTAFGVLVGFIAVRPIEDIFSSELPFLIQFLTAVILVVLVSPFFFLFLIKPLMDCIVSNCSLYLYPFEMELIKEKLATQYHFSISPSPDTIALSRNNTENTEGDEEIEEIEEIKELEIEQIKEIE